MHGEVADQTVDIFDRESVFIHKILQPLVNKLPQLKIVMEHITTRDAVEFVKSCPEGISSYLNMTCFLYYIVHKLIANQEHLLNFSPEL